MASDQNHGSSSKQKEVKDGLPYPKTVWGYEGCGAMWTFFADSKKSLNLARGEEVHEFSIEDAYILDNSRRVEMGFAKITFDEFLDCLNEPAQCQTDESECT